MPFPSSNPSVTGLFRSSSQLSDAAKESGEQKKTGRFVSVQMEGRGIGPKNSRSILSRPITRLNSWAVQ
jgi:hypothetical protein